MRKYKLNENYFNEINTNNKAYFLGFLLADGYVNENKNYVEITVHNQDVDILIKLRNEIYPKNDRPIKTVNLKYS